MMTQMKILEKVSWSSYKFGSESSIESFGNFRFSLANKVFKKSLLIFFFENLLDKDNKNTNTETFVPEDTSKLTLNWFYKTIFPTLWITRWGRPR